MKKEDVKKLAIANCRAAITGGRVGVDDLTGLDEVVVDGFHLEYMSKGHVWIGIDTAAKELIHINLWIEGKKIVGRVEVDRA